MLEILLEALAPHSGWLRGRAPSDPSRPMECGCYGISSGSQAFEGRKPRRGFCIPPGSRQWRGLLTHALPASQQWCISVGWESLISMLEMAPHCVLQSNLDSLHCCHVWESLAISASPQHCIDSTFCWWFTWALWIISSSMRWQNPQQLWLPPPLEVCSTTNASVPVCCEILRWISAWVVVRA